jgi:methanogenic corrinoid protein MtbC1
LAGRSIGQVAELSSEALAELLSSDESRRPDAVAKGSPGDSEQVRASHAECLAAIERLDAAALESCLKRAALRFSVPVLLESLVAPLLRDIGDCWEAGRFLPVHEHLATVEVHRLLMWLIQSARVEGEAPLLVVTTPTGQIMELGALMVAVTAASEGWRVSWLGPNLPAEDILLAVDRLRPEALAVSLIHQTRDPELHRDLERIARGVGHRTQLLVGGRASRGSALMLERHGAAIFEDLTAFRGWLQQHGSRRASAS